MFLRLSESQLLTGQACVRVDAYVSVKKYFLFSFSPELIKPSTLPKTTPNGKRFVAAFITAKMFGNM